MIGRSFIAFRPYADADREAMASVAQGINSGQTISPRGPEAMGRFFAELADRRLMSKTRAEAFVAALDGAPVGLVAIHPDGE